MRNSFKSGRGAGVRAGGNLVVLVSKILRHSIHSGIFPPGTKLPSEARLTQAHGVSRTVVREAIATLRADGLVKARQGAGVFVLEHAAAALSPQSVDGERVSGMLELLEIRTGVEVEAAGLAALRHSPAQEEALFERHLALRSALEAGRSTVDADFSLHLAIADATNNRRFRAFLGSLGREAIPRSALEQECQSLERNFSYLEMIDAEHHRIIAAISAGDEAAAREAMRAHLLGSQSRYRALLLRRREHVIPQRELIL